MGEIFYAINVERKTIQKLGKAGEFTTVPSGCIILGEYDEKCEDYMDEFGEQPKPHWQGMCPKCKDDYGCSVEGEGKLPWKCSCGFVYDYLKEGEWRQYNPSWRKYTVISTDRDYFESKGD